MNDTYWACNLPLQIILKPDTVEPSIVNYSPRRERCVSLTFDELDFDEDLNDPAVLKVFCEETAKRLENLARLFREVGNGERTMVYYPDEGMEETT